MTSAQIRRQFIDFFVQKHRHTFVPSSPVVPHDDPTLLFTNAGMNQFKPIFLGTEKRTYTRAVNTQKCIRAGGKHNDLDDVGRSRRHHTFFEMLGNWSFGDYFKQGAIEMAWELLTEVWKLDPTRLHVSCYEGDEKNGVPRDTEAADIWKKVANWEQFGRKSEDHIHYFGKDNFWEMGDAGPCGPCTEIYIDRTPDKTGGPQVNGEDPRVMEIWNLVFIQYNRNPDRTLTTLPAQHVDTGMGLERICQVIQGKSDNYATDLFTPLFEALTKLTGLQYTGKFPKTNVADPEAENSDWQLRYDIAFRVIADHVRCLTFAIADGAEPSNEGRGYVLRRILRRAVRFGRQQLGLDAPFLHKLVPVAIAVMKPAFPELASQQKSIAKTIREEEISFGRTLSRGIQLFEDASCQAIIDAISSKSGGAWTIEVGLPRIPKDVSGISYLDLKTSNTLTVPFGPSQQQTFMRHYTVAAPTISAKDAFKLHDTYGFPIDLTRIMAEERGMTVDIAGYEKLMEQAREIARAGGKEGESRLFELSPAALAELQKTGVKHTDDSYKFNAAPIGATIKAIWDGHKLIPHTHGAEANSQGFAVIVDRTCFYAEMGGQVGDTGELRSRDGAVMAVETTKSAGGYVLHVGKLEAGHLRVGEHVTGTLAGVRPRTEKNHTSTHLANWALREVLGEGVQQKGSLVDPDKLRFDFSHGKSMSEEELARVEELVNENIAKKLPVYAEEAPQEKALKINGLRAVFGEKYPPVVRVVSIGKPVSELLADPQNSAWRQFSVEFCGGTHLRNTGDAGAFVITAEESVSKGIRRIVALTGDSATAVVSQGKSVDAMVAEARKTPEADLPGVIAALQKSISGGDLSLRTKRRAQAAVAELQDKFKKWEKANKAQASGAKLDVSEVSSKLLEMASPLGPGKLVVGQLPEAAPDQLLSVVDSLKKKAGSYAILLASAGEGKVNFVAAVSDDLIAMGLKAGDWIREAAKATGGGGGGRPQLAQAGGKDPAKLPEALKAAVEYASHVAA